MKSDRGHELTECLVCGNKDLRLVLDLGEQPLANSNLESRFYPESSYPLALNFCNKCTHLQLTYAVNPDLMFRDYQYVTGTSQTMRDYLEWFAAYTIDNSQDVSKDINILDIACNDGTLLDTYMRKGFYNTYGIDPSENLFPISSANHKVTLDYLTWDYAGNSKDLFDVIVAQNVMAHNDYPRDFLAMCKEMITRDGFIYIQNSQADMTKNNEFDTIYHEHLSFYSIESFKTLARRAGLVLVDVVKVPIHGNSHIFVLSKDSYAYETEITDELPLDDKTIDNYAQKCYDLMSSLRDGLEKVRADGYKIIGYGAAAKGNTLINASGIRLDYIVDDNPLKQGLYSPGARIRILSVEALDKEDGKICIVPLAWNYFEEIKSKCLRHIDSKELIFVKYFPEFLVVNGD